MSWISNQYFGVPLGTVIYSRRHRYYQILRRVGESHFSWKIILRNDARHQIPQQVRRNARDRAHIQEALAELRNLGGEMADRDRRHVQQARQARRVATQNSPETTSSGRLRNPSSRNPKRLAALARIRRSR